MLVTKNPSHIILLSLGVLTVLGSAVDIASWRVQVAVLMIAWVFGLMGLMFVVAQIWHKRVSVALAIEGLLFLCSVFLSAMNLLDLF